MKTKNFIDVSHVVEEGAITYKGLLAFGTFPVRAFAVRG